MRIYDGTIGWCNRALDLIKKALCLTAPDRDDSSSTDVVTRGPVGSDTLQRVSSYLSDAASSVWSADSDEPSKRGRGDCVDSDDDSEADDSPNSKVVYQPVSRWGEAAVVRAWQSTPVVPVPTTGTIGRDDITSRRRAATQVVATWN